MTGGVLIAVGIVAAAAATISAGAASDSHSNVGVRAHGGASFTPLSSTSSVVVHTATVASAIGGDPLADDYQVAVPFVTGDTYSVGLTYIAASN